MSTRTDTPHEAAGLSLAMHCPKWEPCSAPFCPLLGGRHLPGERVCLYLREAVKDGGTAILGRTLPAQLARRMVSIAQARLPRPDPLGKALRQASRHGSQVSRGQHLASARCVTGQHLVSEAR